MERHYFIGEGTEAEKLIASMLARREVARKARRSLMHDYESDGLLLSGGRDGSIVGLSFKKKRNIPFLKGGDRIEGGYAYYPKMNTKKGKELAKRLKDGDLTFSASHFIVDALKLERFAFSGRRMYVSVAGTSEDLKCILVSIPGAKEDEDGPSSTFPVIPEWMREVKESEWLAAQGR